jgi:hypothetical protein
MGDPWKSFCEQFKREFRTRFDVEPTWRDTQNKENKASFKEQCARYRRAGFVRANEGFELGDLRCDYAGRTIRVSQRSHGCRPDLRGMFRETVVGSYSLTVGEEVLMGADSAERLARCSRWPSRMETSHRGAVQRRFECDSRSTARGPAGLLVDVRTGLIVA